MKHVGLDLGTKTLVAATREGKGKPKFKQEINGFFVLDGTDSFTKNMLINQKIPFIPMDGKIYALGSKAEKFAYAVNKTLKRPMAEGTVSKEKQAIKLMGALVQAIIGKLEEDAILYYSIPADALNKATNVGFHDKVAKMIFDSYNRTNAKIKSYPINEARALALASGKDIVIAISWGAGMVNACYSMFGMPIFSFSLVGSGDWIDTETAKRFGYDPEKPREDSDETPTSIAKVKHNIDLTKSTKDVDNVERAIMMHYELLIEKVVNGIVDGFNDNANKARVEDAVPIVMAGGTSSPPGFCEYFKQIIEARKDLPFEIASVERMNDPLYSVAEGCLIAAEAHEEE